MDLQHNGLITSEEIYADLCSKIESTEYMPGAKLSENDLCKAYGVSRHVVRNALASLKQRRLVDVYPQRGTFVSLIDMNYIQDILYMREAVEQEALYRIMLREDRTDVTEKMKQILKRQKQMLEDHKFKDEFIEVDNEFHRVLLETVDAGDVMELVAEHYIHIRRWRNFEVRTVERLKCILEEHQILIDSIEKGDEKAAREILHIHLDTVNRYSKPLKEKEAQYFIM